MKRKLCVLVLALLFVVTIFPAGAQAQYQVGQKVNDFTLNDVNGKQISLGQFAGKVIVLNFFTTW
ncbi:MAG TPA: redoxin domain-containing protein [Bacteroidetes bacterium]|nr:redoxin domain-containing protein [Bacteroidota bacterium]